MEEIKMEEIKLKYNPLGIKVYAVGKPGHRAYAQRRV